MGIIFLKLIGFIDIYQIMNIIGNYGNYNLVVIRNYFKRITSFFSCAFFVSSLFRCEFRIFIGIFSLFNFKYTILHLLRFS